MEKKPINNDKRMKRYSYIDELNKQIKIIQEKGFVLRCFGIVEEVGRKFSYALKKFMSVVQ